MMTVFGLIRDFIAYIRSPDIRDLVANPDAPIPYEVSDVQDR